MRNSPRITIGLPITKNKPYYPEVYTDFLGRSSPSVSSYDPNINAIKPKDPNFSQSRFKRFHKPSSLANLQAQLPSQYGQDNKLQLPTYDLMGLGKRFSYKMSKDDETTPGPGMYTNIDINSIKQSVLNHARSSSTLKVYFGGATREQ